MEITPVKQLTQALSLMRYCALFLICWEQETQGLNRRTRKPKVEHQKRFPRAVATRCSAEGGGLFCAGHDDTFNSWTTKLWKGRQATTTD